MKKKKAKFGKKPEKKTYGIYVRFSHETLEKINFVQKKHNFIDRSKTIRDIVEWALVNGAAG